MSIGNKQQKQDMQVRREDGAHMFENVSNETAVTDSEDDFSVTGVGLHITNLLADQDLTSGPS